MTIFLKGFACQAKFSCTAQILCNDYAMPITENDFDQLIPREAWWEKNDEIFFPTRNANTIHDYYQSAWSVLVGDLGKLSADEFEFLSFQIREQSERTLRKQEAIQAELAEAKRTRDYALYQQCRRDLRKLNRQYWSVGSALKSKILVRRKGTERSRSKSGSQTVCTHVLALFESDLEARWLLGLAAEMNRAANARNARKAGVPSKALNEVLNLEGKNFAHKRIQIEQDFTNKNGARAVGRQGAQVERNYPRRGTEVVRRSAHDYDYSCHWGKRLRCDAPLPTRLVRLCDLGCSYCDFGMAISARRTP